MTALDRLIASIVVPDERLADAARQRLDSLTKPRGSLGRLEELAVRVVVITGNPAAAGRCAGDLHARRRPRRRGRGRERLSPGRDRADGRELRAGRRRGERPRPPRRGPGRRRESRRRGAARPTTPAIVERSHRAGHAQHHEGAGDDPRGGGPGDRRRRGARRGGGPGLRRHRGDGDRQHDRGERAHGRAHRRRSRDGHGPRHGRGRRRLGGGRSRRSGGRSP